MDANSISSRFAISEAQGSTAIPLIDESIGEALARSVRTWPDRVALVDGSADAAARFRWTYKQLHHQALRTAWALLSSFKVGDAVAVWAPNCPQWVFMEFGAALAGVRLVTVNPAYKASELLHVLKQSEAKGLVYVPDHRGRDLVAIVREVRSELPQLHTALALPAWVELVENARPVALPVVSPTDIAQIQYTSGTTGFPKGAELTHRGLANNGRLYALTIGATSADVWVNPMPMFHTAGCGLVTLGCLQTGGTHVLPREFDPALMIELLEAERGTIVLSVPTMMLRIMDCPTLATRNVSSWRLATLGGAPVAPELVRRASESLGLAVAIGFGQTESSPYITHTEPDDPHPEWWLTVGKPLPQIELKVIDPETSDVLPVGQVGEVCTRSLCVMRGYYRNPEATKAAISPDGWLRTGDLGMLDAHGYLRIQGRLKDMIIRGGENIYPREIEDLLFTHAAVANVAVVGVPDADWGEVVAAFVQLKQPADADALELEAFCRAALASYKVPRLWRFVDAFPQTASGKIQKFALKAQFERTLHA